MPFIEFNYSIPFNSSLRVGYRLAGSSGPYTYISSFPTYAESPYTLTVPLVTLYEIELSTMCPSCSGSVPSDTYIFQANAT